MAGVFGRRASEFVQCSPQPASGRVALNSPESILSLAFNSNLIKELRAVALLRRVADTGHNEGEVWAKMRVHRIASEEMTQLSSSSKVLAEWSFFCRLRDKGRRAAEAFLDTHGANLGVRSALDLDEL
jgi:NTE family protein